MCDSKLFGLRPFDNMAISWVKDRSEKESSLWVHGAPILDLIFVTLTENSSVVTNYSKGTVKCPDHRKYLLLNTMALKLPWVFLPADGESSWSLQVWFPYDNTAQCNQETRFPVSLWWQVRSEKAKKEYAINTNHRYHQCSSP